MTKKSQSWARAQMLLIAAVFLGPLVVAAYMYYGGSFAPAGRTNHGTLLEPIVNVPDALPNSETVAMINGRWGLLFSYQGDCDQPCRDGLYTMRQLRRLLGKDRDRLERVFLHSEISPDTVFLANEHAGLIAVHDDELVALLKNKKPATKADGGFFLIDPLGNLVMYFDPAIDPSETFEDIRRLFKFSHIG